MREDLNAAAYGEVARQVLPEVGAAIGRYA